MEVSGWTLLHVEDSPFDAEMVERALQGTGARYFNVEGTKDLEDHIRAFQPDVMLIDLDLGAEATASGLTALCIARGVRPEAIRIVLTGADVAMIQEALAAGADDLISKDIPPDELRALILASCALARQNRLPPPSPTVKASAVGATMQAIAARIPRIAASAARCVHVAGESGTGKELVAVLIRETVHPAPFVSINCAAVPKHLSEAAFFGSARGSFTGAVADRKGYLTAANGGWLFLDEIGCLELPMQASLLRAIDNQEIVRVGDSVPTMIDVRFVTATNESLERLVQGGTFRRDLWQRLEEIRIELPPLRERPDEIDPLIDRFLETLSGGPYTITSALRKILRDQSWSDGNVRELRNCLRAMTEMRIGRSLTPQGLPERYRVRTPTQEAPARTTASSDLRLARLVSASFVAAIRELGLGGRQLSLADVGDALGVSRSTVSRRLTEAIRAGHVSFDEVQRLVRIKRPRPGS